MRRLLLLGVLLVLGLAGANVGTYRQQLEAILPFSKSRVETDAEIALEGAVGSGDGAAPLFDDFMRQLCTDCWLEDPEARPSFATISERFTAYMTRKIQGNQKK